MAASQDDKIGGALYDAILRQGNPCSAADLGKEIKVKEEKAVQILQKLCENGIVCQLGEKYISAELASKEPMVTRCDRPLSNQAQALVPLERGGRVNTSIVTRSQVMQCDVAKAEVERNEDAIQKILRVLSRHGGPVKSHVIAKETGLGESKSAVNRHLHFLVKQGVLSNSKIEFSLIKQDTTDEEVKVMAAQLAKQPQGKKKTGSTSPANSSENCACPNRGSGCNHFTQNVHNHEYNIQVGDNNNIYLGSGGPKRSDD